MIIQQNKIAKGEGKPKGQNKIAKEAGSQGSR